jgi:hypothetical protein
VYWLGYVTAVVVLAAYSATLISFLTIQSKEPPLKTLEALVADRTYDVGLLREYLRIIEHVRLQPGVLLLQNRKLWKQSATPTFKCFCLTDEAPIPVAVRSVRRRSEAARLLRSRI